MQHEFHISIRYLSERNIGRDVLCLRKIAADHFDKARIIFDSLYRRVISRSFAMRILTFSPIESIFLNASFSTVNRFRYLQEYASLGTAGSIYHFRDQITSGNPDAFFVMNSDICADFPLVHMVNFHKNLVDKRPVSATPQLDLGVTTILGTEATPTQVRKIMFTAVLLQNFGVSRNDRTTRPRSPCSSK